MLKRQLKMDGGSAILILFSVMRFILDCGSIVYMTT
jgi:hypothetical protein